jgi:hypothetical protein
LKLVAGQKKTAIFGENVFGEMRSQRFRRGQSHLASMLQNFFFFVTDAPNKYVRVFAPGKPLKHVACTVNIS